MWSLFFPDGQRAGLSGFSPICSFCAAPGNAYFLRLAGNFLSFSNILPQPISSRRHSSGAQAVYSALKGAAQFRAAVCGKTNGLTVRHTAEAAYWSIYFPSSCRVLTCSFPLASARWRLTVWEEMPMCPAISSLVQPRAASMATANSVVVRLSAT